MGKTSERLETYQTQMSIYAEQHKMILASDVLDMIEQLQDDLKDDVDKVVEELDESFFQVEQLVDKDGYKYKAVKVVELDMAIDIVRNGGVE